MHKYKGSQIVLILLLAFLSKAHAVDVEVQAGITKFKSPPSGLWLRDKQGYSTKKRLMSENVSVSIFKEVYPNFEGHLSISYLGHYKTDGVAPGDEACAGNGGGAEMCGENSNYHTSGNMNAIGAEMRNYFTLFHTQFFVQGGLHLTRQEFMLRVSEQQNGLLDYEYGPEVKYGLGKSIAVGVKSGKMIGSLNFYKSGADGKFYHGEYPSGVGQAIQLTLGRRFQ